MMQAMVMNDDPAVHVGIATALIADGFQVLALETADRACAWLAAAPVDLLILPERIGPDLAHTVALAAEAANPMLTTILLTDRADPAVEELYRLWPSLYALLAPQTDPWLIACLARAAVAAPGAAEDRARRAEEARLLQPLADWAAVFGIAAADMPEETAEDLVADDWIEAFDASHADDFAAEEPAEGDAEFAPMGLAEGDRVEPAADVAAAPEQVPDEVPEAEIAARALAPSVAVLDRIAAEANSFDDAFAELLRDEEARMPAEPAPVFAEEPETSPLNTLFAPLPEPAERAVAARPVPVAPRPLPPMVNGIRPEIVPPREIRTDWIADTLRDLERTGQAGRGRMRIA